MSHDLASQVAFVQDIITDKGQFAEMSETLQRLAMWVYAMHQFQTFYAEDLLQVRKQLQALEGTEVPKEGQLISQVSCILSMFFVNCR